MDTTIIITLSSFVFLVGLWVAVGIRHLRISSKSVHESWEFADEKIRERHDLIVLLVESMRPALGESGGNDGGNGGGNRNSGGEFLDLVEKMIKVRDEARRIYFPSGDKTEKEYDLSKIIDALVKLGDKNELVSKSTHFLGFKNDIFDLNRNIENRAADYNEVVRKFNNTRKIFILVPLVCLLNLKQALIFEFEK